MRELAPRHAVREVLRAAALAGPAVVAVARRLAAGAPASLALVEEPLEEGAVGRGRGVLARFDFIAEAAAVFPGQLGRQLRPEAGGERAGLLAAETAATVVLVAGVGGRGRDEEGGE